MVPLDPWGWAQRRRKHHVRALVVAALIALSGAGTVGYIVHEEGWDCVESKLRGYLWMTSNCGTGEVGEP